MTISEQVGRLWTETVLESIYKIYPRKENRKQAVQRIREALNRICAGEIDGRSRTQEDAVAYLRERTEECRTAMYGKPEKFVPHPTTYYHQSRYLRRTLAPEVELPRHLDDCIAILAVYPNSRRADDIRHEVNAYLPTLAAISKAIDVRGEPFIHSRTVEYAFAVSSWPKNELRFVPNAKKWFEEGHYDRDPKLWQRNRTCTYQDDRQQIARVIGSIRGSGDRVGDGERSVSDEPSRE